MYAVRKIYTKQWGHQSADERYTVKVDYGGKPVAGLQSDRISAVEESVMYWRKANHIHGWMVKNVQLGRDDCLQHYLDFETLAYLADDCRKVVEASKLVDGTVVVGEVWNPDTNAWDEQREPGKVIEDSTVAKAVLPRTQGFFFGSYEYDQGYLDDVVATLDWANRMILDFEMRVPGDIYYSSSW